MQERVLGVPFYVWGGLCLVVALVFTVVWPGDRVLPGETGLRYLILRWSHVLVWLLLGVSCFVRGLGGEGGAGMANLIALAAGLTYLVFMVTLIRGSV
jgi:hypothetical protein